MDVEFYKSILKNSSTAIGICKVLLDHKNSPIDYEYIDINSSYEKQTGLNSIDIIGKKATEIFSFQDITDKKWLIEYGDIAINGGEKEYIHFYDGVFDYYNVKIFSPQKYYFVVSFNEIKKSLNSGQLDQNELFISKEIDLSELQPIIDSFFEITHIAIAIGDLNGNLLIQSRFQNICDYFHRSNKLSCENCIRSNQILLNSAIGGEMKQYKCLNNMWDISAPIKVAGKIIGILYLGQFFYDDEQINYDEFIIQADKFNFDTRLYIEALKSVPIVSKEYIDNVISLYLNFAKIVALLSYKNLNIISKIDEQNKLVSSLEKMDIKLKSLLNKLPDGIALYNSKSKISYINDSLLKLLKVNREEIIEMDIESIDINKSNKQIVEIIKKTIKTKKIQSVETLYQVKNGLHKNFLVKFIPLYDNNGEMEFIEVIHDYTNHKKIEEDKIFKDELISDMGKMAKIGGWEFDAKTGNGTWTEQVARIHDINPKIDTNLRLGLSCYTISSKVVIENAIERAIKSAEPYDLELEMLTKKGNRKWVRTIGKPVVQGGEVIKIRGSFQEITEKKQTEQKIKESEERYRTLLNKAPIGIAVHSKGKIVFANPTALKMFGAKTKNQLVGKNIVEIIDPDGLKITLERIKRMEAGEKGLYPAYDVYTRLDGSKMSVEVMATKIKYNGDSAVQVIVTDITERKKNEERLEYLSYNDQLTGVFNRRYFAEIINKIDVIENLPITFIMADVNGLKMINDSFGHIYGDELLVKASNAMKSVCRESDIIARLGGDEFVLIAPRTDNKGAKKLINKMQKMIIKENVEAISMSVSFGYQIKLNKEENIHKILSEAEDNLYKHKIYESASMHSKSVEIIMNALYEKSKRELLHSRRVSNYCKAIATELDLPISTINQIKTAGLVHDIGKIGVEEKILNKPGKLNPEEMIEIKKHPERGWRIFDNIKRVFRISRFCVRTP